MSEGSFYISPKKNAKKTQVAAAISKDGKSFNSPQTLLTLRPAVGQKIVSGSFDFVRASSAGPVQTITFFKKLTKNQAIFIRQVLKKWTIGARLG